MKRIDFFKRIAVSVVGAGLIGSVKAEEINTEIPFDDIFEVCHGNPRLLDLKHDSPIFAYFKTELGERVTNESGLGVFMGVHDVILEEKKYYTIDDFACVIRCLNGRHRKNNTFTKDIMRFIRDGNGIHPDLFTIHHY